jgi:DNA-directed RNA polymerase subunit RPC12/RpoP
MQLDVYSCNHCAQQVSADEGSMLFGASERAKFTVPAAPTPADRRADCTRCGSSSVVFLYTFDGEPLPISEMPPRADSTRKREMY